MFERFAQPYLWLHVRRIPCDDSLLCDRHTDTADSRLDASESSIGRTSMQ